MSIKGYPSKTELAEIINKASDLNKTESEELVSILLKHLDSIIVYENDLIECYFSNDNDDTASTFYRNDYVIEKVINEHKYRIAFDSYGLLLFKLFISYVSGGLSSTIFASIEEFVEYIVKSNVPLGNIETCVLYTILSDKNCRENYFSAEDLFNKYYKDLYKKDDTCMISLIGTKCYYNEYYNKCTIPQKKIADVLHEFERKKIIISDAVSSNIEDKHYIIKKSILT